MNLHVSVLKSKQSKWRLRKMPRNNYPKSPMKNVESSPIRNLFKRDEADKNKEKKEEIVNEPKLSENNGNNLKSFELFKYSEVIDSDEPEKVRKSEHSEIKPTEKAETNKSDIDKAEK